MPSQKSPAYLKKGDKIGVVAPAGKVSRDAIIGGINKLHEWGLEVELGSSVLKEFHQFAGTDEERVSDLQRMLDDPSISAIISARGGYGTLRIIDKINFNLFCKNPKWIIGFSDITVLHSHIHKNFGIETLHGIMLTSFEKNEEAVETVRKILFKDELNYKVEPYPLNRPGHSEGEITGGNLSLLYAMNASNSDIDTTGKLLFIEDVGEYLYHLDRMMINLKRSGKLNNLAGLIVGGMTEMKDNNTPFGKTAEEIIHQAVSGYKYPVCFNFPAGHIEKNIALVFGRRARFSVNEKEVTLSYL